MEQKAGVCALKRPATKAVFARFLCGRG